MKTLKDESTEYRAPLHMVCSALPAPRGACSSSHPSEKAEAVLVHAKRSKRFKAGTEDAPPRAYIFSAGATQTLRLKKDESAG